MNNVVDPFENPELDDFYDRTERIDGPEVQGFAPTLQELIQLVKFHVREFIELHWIAFVSGLQSSKAAEDAIWARLEKIRRVVKEDDFERAVRLACLLCGAEVDAIIWDVFVYGDEDLRRATALEIQQTQNKDAPVLSEELSRRIDQVRQGQRQETPPEVLERMAQLRCSCNSTPQFPEGIVN